MARVAEPKIARIDAASTPNPEARTMIKNAYITIFRKLSINVMTPFSAPALLRDLLMIRIMIFITLVPIKKMTAIIMILTPRLNAAWGACLINSSHMDGSRFS